MSTSELSTSELSIIKFSIIDFRKLHFDQIELALVATLPLKGEALAVDPIHAGQINVRFCAKVEPLHRCSEIRRARVDRLVLQRICNRNHTQLDGDIGIAGGGVALRDHR